MTKKLMYLLMLLYVAGFSQAAIISVNATDGGSLGTSAAQTAGAVLAGYWNEIGPNPAVVVGTTDVSNLLDDSGAASGVSLVQSDWIGAWYHQEPDYPSGFSGTIGNDIFGNFSDTDFAYTYTFSNVNAGVTALYDVYIYSARGFANTGVTQFDVNGETKFLVNENIVGDYAESGWSSQALAEANPDSGNYVRFRNVSLDTLVIGINGLEDLTNGGATGCVAGIQLVEIQGDLASQPDPENGEPGVALDTLLKWNNPIFYEATNYAIDIRENDANWLDTGNTYSTASVVDLHSDPLTTTAALPAGLTLDYDTTYFWRVTSTDPNIGGTAKNWVGPDWTFDAESSLTVDSGPSSVTWLNPTLATVDLTGSVAVGAGTGNSVTSILWTVADNPETGLPDIPSGSTVNITSPTSAVTTATMDTQGIYYLQLAGEDSTGLEKIELLKVTVASDACAAAKEGENPPMGYIAPIHDSNDDCIVNLTDFAAFAAEWVDNKALTENFEYIW